MRKQIEMLPTTLMEKEYVLAVQSLLKKRKEGKYDKRKKNFAEQLKKQKTKIETCIYNEFTLSDKRSTKTLGLTRDEVVEHFFKKLRRKRRFQRMEWVSVPSCDVTYECMMEESCNSMISEGKYKSGGYFNILTKEYVCNNILLLFVFFHIKPSRGTIILKRAHVTACTDIRVRIGHRTACLFERRRTTKFRLQLDEKFLFGPRSG